jgi:hypothetical protein
MIGRNTRPGQLSMCDWHFVHVVDTYHDHQLFSTLNKWVRLVVIKGNIPSFLSPILQEIVAHEMLKAHLNLSFNRFAWTIYKEIEGTNMAYERGAGLPRSD